MGARAIMEACCHPFYNQLPRGDRKNSRRHPNRSIVGPVHWVGGNYYCSASNVARGEGGPSDSRGPHGSLLVGLGFDMHANLEEETRRASGFRIGQGQ